MIFQNLRQRFSLGGKFNQGSATASDIMTMTVKGNDDGKLGLLLGRRLKKASLKRFAAADRGGDNLRECLIGINLLTRRPFGSWKIRLTRISTACSSFFDREKLRGCEAPSKRAKRAKRASAEGLA